MTLIPGLRRALETVPEVIDTTDYTDRLARLGGLNPTTHGLLRIAATVWRFLWVTLAIVSPLMMGILRWLGEEAPLTNSGSQNEFLTMTAWVFWIIQFMVTGLAFMFYQLYTLVWYIRHRRWRVRLGQSRIAIHLALAPAGGWFLAACVARSWQRHMITFLLPPMALTLSLVVSLGVGMVNEALIREFLTTPGAPLMAAAIAGIALLYLSGYVLLGLMAFCFIGSPTRRNWLLVVLLALSSLPGMSPLNSITGPGMLMATQIFNVGFFLILQLLILGAAWGLVIRHLRHAGAEYSQKILTGRRSPAAAD